jgi:hypothetical protein
MVIMSNSGLKVVGCLEGRYDKHNQPSCWHVLHMVLQRWGLATLAMLRYVQRSVVLLWYGCGMRSGMRSVMTAMCRDHVVADMMGT